MNVAKELEPRASFGSSTVFKLIKSMVVQLFRTIELLWRVGAFS